MRLLLGSAPYQPFAPGEALLQFDDFAAFHEMETGIVLGAVDDILINCDFPTSQILDPEIWSKLHDVLAPGGRITLTQSAVDDEWMARVCHALFMFRFNLITPTGEPGRTYSRHEVTAIKNPILPRRRVTAVMSTPRFGPIIAQSAMYAALFAAGRQVDIDLVLNQGVWWHHGLTRTIESVLEDPAVDYILTIDFDSMIAPEHVVDLVTMAEISDFDILFPLQMRRGRTGALLGGENMDTRRSVVEAHAGHLGLTLFRRDVFTKLEKPWFTEIPDDRGGWGDGRVDPDIAMWANARRQGLRIGCMPHVHIGHLEEMVALPQASSRGIETRYVTPLEWAKMFDRPMEVK